jgi:phage tail sheath protein FI
MGFQLSPGVNVSEIDLTNVVPGASSSIGAFAGQFSWGPAAIRVLVDSENRLASIFGKPNNNNFTSFFTAANFLAYTNNLRVVRAIDNSNTFNSTSISDFIDLTTLTVSTNSSSNNVVFTDDVANYIERGDTFNVTTPAGDRFTLTANTVSGNTVVVYNNLVGTSTGSSVALPTTQTNVSIANETDYELNFQAGTYSKYGAFFGRYPGVFGNSLTISVCSSANSFSKIGLTANTTDASSTVILNTGYANTFLSTGDVITIGGADNEVVSIGAVTAATSSVELLNPLVGTKTDVTTTTKWAYADQFDSAPGTSQYVANKNARNDEMHIIVIDTDGRFTGERGTILEKYSHTSKADDARTDDGSPNYYVTKIFNDSKYIYVADHINGSTNWGSVSEASLSFDYLVNYSSKLSGGTDVAPTTADIYAGYDLFADPDEVDISLLLTGDNNTTIVNRALDIVNQRKDCVAFVSPTRADAVESVNLDNIIAYRNTLTPSTSYSVFDSGWKYQFDKYNNKYRFIPLNADIAGLCARTDNVRDPWWSPAGFNRGQILNAIKLSWNPSKAQRDELYKNGINPVVAFPGEGIILYGDKTMQTKPSAFDRINVRRLFIVLEKAIAIAAKYSLFEFNDAFTRAQFVSIVEPFLRDVKGRRGIYDYKVVCDDTNNTAEVIDTNRFVGDIYIKPARSINFIQLNFVAVRTGVDFTEIAGNF